MGARIMTARSEARFFFLLLSGMRNVVICLVNFTFADLGRHHQATVCHRGSHQDGAVCAKTQAKAKAKVVDSYIPYVHVPM